MGEKRVPEVIILLRIPGKSKKAFKLELYPAWAWNRKGRRWRLRTNGKWYPKAHEYRFFDFYEIRDLLWKSLKDWFKKGVI